MSQMRPTARDALIEAAFVVFAANPGASLGEVASRAGVGRATLHRYFPARDDLMLALAQVAHAELEDAVAQAVAGAMSHEDGLRRAMYAIVPLAGRQWFLSQDGVDLSPEIAAAQADSRRAFYADIDAAKAAGLFDPATPTAWIAEAYDNLIYAAWSLVRSGEVTPKQAADLAWSTFCNGVKEERP